MRRGNMDKERLQKIKEYCKYYDYLDCVNLSNLNWLIQTIEDQQKELESWRKEFMF
jgi:hypothetical protein